MRTLTKLCITVAAVALAVATTANPAGTTQGVKNIVLVHGAFADGSSWSRVIKLLHANGYYVSAVHLPLTSFADDVAATKRTLARQDGPVILVGHSWAGVVITETGVDPQAAGLVYVAAFAPDVDETVGDLGKNYPPSADFGAKVSNVAWSRSRRGTSCRKRTARSRRTRSAFSRSASRRRRSSSTRATCR